MLTISVIIPTHNRADLLARAIESVLAQTYGVLELIIVDDGSTDGTKTIVEGFLREAAALRCRIQYIYQEQGGAPVARNTGLASAAGDWIAFLDSDDRWLPEKIEWQVKALNQLPGESLACVTNAVFLNNEQLRESAFQHAGAQCEGITGHFRGIVGRIAYGYHGLYLQTLLLKRQLAMDIGGFDPALPLGDDSDLLFAVALRTHISYVSLPLVEIDRTPNRQVGLIELARQEAFRLKTSQYLYEKWLKTPSGFPLEIRKSILKRLQEIHTGWASWHLLRGDRKEALKSMSLAVRYNLNSRSALKWCLVKAMPSLTRALVVKRRERAPVEALL